MPDDIPEGMLTRDREPDPDFDPGERLFRRARGEDIDGTEVAIDAIELPDMSVNREKYGPPEWLFVSIPPGEWGVVAFRVRDIPPERPVLHLGTIAYTFRPVHAPTRHNYPHSEVRAFRDGEHIGRANISLLTVEDKDFYLRWRERLSRCSKVVIAPRQIG